MTEMERVGQILGPAPWNAALLAELRRVESERDKLREEKAQLLALISKLKHRLAECRRRLENWELRRQAWGRERSALLAKLVER